MTCRRIAALLLFCTVALQAQDAPSGVRLEQVDIPGFTGVQSFAFGRHDGKWGRFAEAGSTTGTGGRFSASFGGYPPF